MCARAIAYLSDVASDLGNARSRLSDAQEASLAREVHVAHSTVDNAFSTNFLEGVTAATLSGIAAPLPIHLR